MKSYPFKSYREALNYLYSQLPMYQRQGAAAYKKDLTNTLLLCEAAGHPERSLKFIHIAGTNGKGTVSHIIAACLAMQGYKTGIYTSPHYKDFRERIKINGVYISRNYILKFLNSYYTEIEKIRPSFFEMCVCLTFCYFRDMKVDNAVIETGLGGRLDSTNVITPMLSVITNISYDHQQMLGNTLQEIAGEKAGIIKPKVPVVIGEWQQEINHVFSEKAKQHDAAIFYAEKDCHLVPAEDSGDHMKCYQVNIQDQCWIPKICTDLTGPFQEKNLITALYSMYKLSEMIPISTEKISDHFDQLKKMTAYIGRWQILGNDPLIIADSAHNIAGISQLVFELRNISFEKLHIVTGFANDKDISDILEILPPDARYYFAKANIPRGLQADILQKQAADKERKGQAYTTVRKAFAAAKKRAGTKDLIIICGSIFVVAEVI
jgi:dihydrofolate synthase / folylpolyglutamate synthase